MRDEPQENTSPSLTEAVEAARLRLKHAEQHEFGYCNIRTEYLRKLLSLVAQNERYANPTPEMINAAWNEVRRWWPVGQPVRVDHPMPGFREAMQAMARAALFEEQPHD